MRGDQRVFRVLKGVSTVDYCHKNNALVTGSTDQIIRIWNPFINTYAVSIPFTTLLSTIPLPSQEASSSFVWTRLSHFLFEG